MTEGYIIFPPILSFFFSSSLHFIKLSHNVTSQVSLQETSETQNPQSLNMAPTENSISSYSTMVTEHAAMLEKANRKIRGLADKNMMLKKEVVSLSQSVKALEACPQPSSSI